MWLLLQMRRQQKKPSSNTKNQGNMIPPKEKIIAPVADPQNGGTNCLTKF